MAREVQHFEVTVPAGTLKTAPQTTSLAMPPRLVQSVSVRIPPGPAGTVGWALGAAGVRVLPTNADQWIVADNERIDWPLVDQITSGAWELQAYNTGVYDHTLYITFLVDLVGATATTLPAAPLAIGG